METVRNPLLFLILARALCFQVTQPSNLTKAKSVDKDDGKSSLAFVFDTTGSMFNDLRQLREGAEMILNTALEDSSVISNFVFVPFHDPTVGPATVTKDKRVFKAALNVVDVYGGGDCPEKSLGGIQLALNLSLPRSYIYVFTDATASDHRLVAKVLDMVQRKQSQVVFVLTGHCNDLHKPSYRVYQQIAAASSGQVFNLNKTNVHMVLDFVRSSIKGRAVNLASAIRPAGYNFTQGIQVDKLIGEVTVSVSGSRPQIEVVNPSGEKLTGPPQLVTTLDLSEIMIVKVLDPEPGNWSITVGSEKDYSVKVVGLSNLTFSHGFSVEPAFSMAETAYRPLQGTYNNMLILLSKPDIPVKIDFAEVLNLEGKTIFEVPLKTIDSEKKLYRADAFLPPDDFFYIAINGHDDHGQGFRRIASTAVQSKSPDAPFLTAPQKVQARYHEQVVLSCGVESLVPVKAAWSKGVKSIQEQINALQSTRIEYVIADMDESQAGEYRCKARNVAGASEARTRLELTVDPPQVSVSPSNATVAVDGRLTIACAVLSEAPLRKAQIVFSSIERQNLTDFSLERAPDGFYSYNVTLERVSETDGGKYTCVAANRGGQSKQSTYITIQARPIVQILGPHALAKLIHSDVQFVCHVENCARVRWLGPDDVIASESDVTGAYNAVLDVKNITKDGTWKCVATRGAYQAEDAIEVTVLMKPQVRIEGEHNITVVNGSVARVSCLVAARPAPRLLWHRETEAFLHHEVTVLENHTYKSVLTLDSTKEMINGTYFCFGENSEGIDQDSITVNVRRKMVLLKGFTDQSVELYSQVDLHCRVDSHPPAVLTWLHNGTALALDLLSEDHSVVYVQKVDFSDLGLYTCVADNGYERIDVNGSLTVQGLESPAMIKEPSKMKIKKGEATVLTCRVVKGNPEPTVEWQFKNDSSANFTQLTNVIALEDRYEVQIPRADVTHTGSYRCVATNVVGRDEYNVQLLVQFPPRLSKANVSRLEAPIELKVGKRTTLRCEADGIPPPIVTWSKHGQPISFSSSVHLTDNNELVIEAATDYDSGVYTCIVSNSIGSEQRNFTLLVYSPPEISPPGIEPEVHVLEGQLVELPCIASGAPPPALQWLQNGAPVLGRRMYIDEFGLRFVANLTDFGEYICLVRNNYGNKSISYTVFVWVPPHIQGPMEEKKSVLMGSNVTLSCDAVGFPVPTIMWEFQGLLLTENSSNVQFDSIGNLVIKTAAQEHSGVFACVAENMVGIEKKYIWLRVDVSPTILPDNYTGPYLATNMDSALSIPCRAQGSPRPYVVWSHDDHYLDTDSRFTTNADGTLMITSPSVELSGEYTCLAKNIVGNASKTVTVEIYPFFKGVQGEESQSSVTLVEGSPAAVPCPVQARTPLHGTVKWYKDAVLIANGALTFNNVSRDNSSTYACVASNAVASAYANVAVLVQWAPRFVENLPEDVEVVKGNDWYFDCRVDAKPRARVKWYFNSWVMAGEDVEVLKILNAQVQHTGTYKCVASNDHGTISRQFTFDVIVPPTISEFDVLDVVLKEGSSATLDCDACGSPSPNITWTYNNTEWSQVNSSLHAARVTAASEGVYRCSARNKAGAAILWYRVRVAAPAAIVGLRAVRAGGAVEDVSTPLEVALRTDVRIACQANGSPIPIIRWMKHDNTLSENEEGVSYAELVMKNVSVSDAGLYSCVAANEGGLDVIKVKVEVLEPPRIFQSLYENANSSDSMVKMEVVSGQPFYLHCHPSGTPFPDVYWFKDELPLRLFDASMVSADYGETLEASEARVEQSGNYTCVARNKVGNTSVSYLVDVLAAPPPLKDNIRTVRTHAHAQLRLECPAQGRPPPRVTWRRAPYTEIGEHLPRVTLINDNYTLLINDTVSSDSGQYICEATNKLGSTEVVFAVTVTQAPSIAGAVGADGVERHVVPLGHSLVLKCEVDGHPPPKISWLKDVLPLAGAAQVALRGRALALWAVSARDAARYICVAENAAGSALRRYDVRVLVPGKWSAWSQWGYCNATCGAGAQARTRHCRYVDEDNFSVDKSTETDKIILDESSCKGASIERRKCQMPPCEEEGWSPWSRWGRCSATCGAGTQARVRRCRADACAGDNVQIRKCPGLPKCDGLSDNTESNEVLSNRENRETYPAQSNPDTPAAEFETQAEIVDSHRADTDLYLPPVSFPQQGYFEVNVSGNLDLSPGGRCGPGYSYDATDDSCHDIDECDLESNQCHATQLCANVPGAYRCACPVGYMALGAGMRCLDVNECATGVATCQYACVNVAGGYVCACPRHLRLHADRRHCVAPSLYREPVPYEDSNTEGYLSTSLEHPALYSHPLKTRQ